MIVKGIVDEDFVNYKKPSMFIIFPRCSFKCGQDICHNTILINEPDIEINSGKLYERYKNNPLTSAIVFGGLEPLDSLSDIVDFLQVVREDNKDFSDVVIYTGYTEEEAKDKIGYILDSIGWSNGRNIIVKYGRYKPDEGIGSFSEELGIVLATANQYAKYLY